MLPRHYLNTACLYDTTLYPITKKEETPTPPPLAEFILTVHWDVELNADIDTWALRVDNPESITGFTRRENDVFILHNDNTSSQYGQIDGEVLDEARETLTIEKVKEGEYIFAFMATGFHQTGLQ